MNRGALGLLPSGPGNRLRRASGSGYESPSLKLTKRSEQQQTFTVNVTANITWSLALWDELGLWRGATPNLGTLAPLAPERGNDKLYVRQRGLYRVAAQVYEDAPSSGTNSLTQRWAELYRGSVVSGSQVVLARQAGHQFAIEAYASNLLAHAFAEPGDWFAAGYMVGGASGTRTVSSGWLTLELIR